MSHFLVDDQFAFHPKALAAGNAAVGLWVRAGAYSKQHVTGGFVSARVALSMGTKAEVRQLVAAGLWDVVDGGYHFHDWEDIAGNAAAAVERDRRDKAREANRKRQADYAARRKADKTASANAPDDGLTNGVSNAPLTGAPSPSPDDVTTLNESGHQPQRASKDPDSGKSWAKDAALLGISDLPAIRAALEAAVEHPVSNPVAVELAASVLSKAKDPVRNVDAYLAESIRNSAAELQGVYFDLDVEQMAS